MAMHAGPAAELADGPMCTARHFAATVKAPMSLLLLLLNWLLLLGDSTLTHTVAMGMPVITGEAMPCVKMVVTRRLSSQMVVAGCKQ